MIPFTPEQRHIVAMYEALEFVARYIPSTFRRLVYHTKMHTSRTAPMVASP